MSVRPATKLDLQIALSTILMFAKDANLIGCTTYLGFMRRSDAVEYAEKVLASSRDERKQAAADAANKRRGSPSAGA